MPRHLTRAVTLALAAILALAGVACSDDDGTADPEGGSPPSDAVTSGTDASEPLVVLVTNDDGIAAPGIDALVSALNAEDDIEVVVVAPAENQSGSSDTTTEGGADHEPGATASGVEGTAVDGFPADTIEVALDELDVTPHLVVSGVNEGQNVGPLAPLSGTLGAARTAARRGIPAVAASAGLDDLADFEGAAELVVAWIHEHHQELIDGTANTDTVTSFNVPGCATGTAQDLVEVPLATEIPAGVNPLVTADCGAELAEPPSDDIAALAGGHQAVTEVPLDL